MLNRSPPTREARRGDADPSFPRSALASAHVADAGPNIETLWTSGGRTAWHWLHELRQPKKDGLAPPRPARGVDR